MLIRLAANAAVHAAAGVAVAGLAAVAVEGWRRAYATDRDGRADPLDVPPPAPTPPSAAGDGSAGESDA
ncbi:hypothetical protein SAMN05216241_103181 [Limimonas halophila]|uniref:Uncharacterized protein n=1 Tax=Limimonas halophila TaxID=1082479 RepID=A0A1G7Q332_9PROT|nr:hypothetical protein [Limimonas halophila]SDF92339.1 hypothetical protein SAMN05216241_103181 [Limimonas halophila]